MLQKNLRKLIKLMGFQLYSQTCSWTEDEAFIEAQRRVAVRNMQGIPDDCCFTLFRIAQATTSLQGDLIECGCQSGKSSRFLLAGEGIESDKMLHAFDAFKEASDPNKQDVEVNGQIAWTGGTHTAAESTFLHNMQMYEHLVMSYDGRIPERFEDVAGKTFSMAHINVELYQPTMDSLDFIYPRMVSGGVIVCHDYGSKKNDETSKAFDEFFASRGEAVIELPTSQAIVVKA